MRCPQCGHEQVSGDECQECGIIFSKWKPPETAPSHENLAGPLGALFGDLNVIRLIENPRGLLSMVTGWPVAREFDIVDSIGRQRGSAAQEGTIMPAASRRFAVFDYPAQQLIATFTRTGFWASHTIVEGAHADRLGSVRRRFSLLRLRYDLCDAAERIFGTVVSGAMQRWVLAVYDRSGQQRGEISRKWSGLSQEMADARRMQIDFNNFGWTVAERAVILAAAVCVDFDTFEGRRRIRV